MNISSGHSQKSGKRNSLIGLVGLLCLLSGLPLRGQHSGGADCFDYITPCYFGIITLASNGNGPGIDDFDNPNNQAPECGFEETQSLWIKIPIDRDGILEFELLSLLDPNDDINFAIYGPNVRCDSLGASIRCSSANPNGVDGATGLRASETDANDGPGDLGNGFVSALPVRAGEEYFMLVDNFSQSEYGFFIGWAEDAPLPELPVIEFPGEQYICDPDGDGRTEFDMTAKVLDVITNGRDDYEVTFHESRDDAQQGINAFSSTAYPVRDGFEFVYARILEPGNPCHSFVSFVIRAIDEPILDNLSGPQSVCPASPGIPYSVNALGLDNIVWEVDGGQIVSGENTADILVDWGESNENAGIRVYGWSTTGCFSDTLNLPVRVNDRLEPALPQGPEELCALSLNNITYTVPQGIGSQYEWEVINGEITGNNNQNSITVNWNEGVSMGRVFYREFNPSLVECEGFSDTLNVRIVPPISAEALVQRPLCNRGASGAIQLSVAGGAGTKNVLWDNGAQGDVLENITSGNYGYTITDESGCEIQGVVNVGDPEALNIGTLAITDAACFGEASGTLITEITGGVGGYRFELGEQSGSINGNQLTLNNLTSGDYLLNILDANGCRASSTFSIEAPSRLEPDLEQLVVKAVCPDQSDGEIAVGARGGTPDYQFIWGPDINQTGPVVTGLARGNYQVRIVDAQGCEAVLNVAVNEIIPRVIVPTAFSPNGDENNDEFAPVVTCTLTSFRMQVFDRWGTLVYVTEDQQEGWNGEVAGKPAPTGRYSYQVVYESTVNGVAISEKQQGTLRLFR